MNPLLLNYQRWRQTGALRRHDIAVPTQVPTTDAIFMVLRRMRGPLIVMIVVFVTSVVGLTQIPGRDTDGNVYYMTAFDAFYFISYTALTIGFGETPYELTVSQRLWVTGSIYSSVVAWTYAIGTVLALMQGQTFQDAIATGRFKRRVRNISEPFHILVGYGQSGKYVAQVLAAEDRRLVVVEKDRAKVEGLEAAQFSIDVPGITANAATPQILGMAGLGNPHCSGVLAISGDETTNLSIVMMANLLSPNVPVVARCSTRATAQAMKEFAPRAVLNPYDRYGEYLILALSRPATYQLITWLLSPPGTELPERHEGLLSGQWMVVSDDQFGQEISKDLETAGLNVVLFDPDDGLPEVENLRGLVAGTSKDTLNLTLAAHTRLSNPDAFLSVRQRDYSRTPMLHAFGPDSLFIPTELVARECLARIITPVYWSTLEELRRLDDKAAASLIDRLVDHSGIWTPRSTKLRLDSASAPAVVAWLRRENSLTIGDLLRYPDDRETELQLVAMSLIRDGDTTILPSSDIQLEVDDELVLAGRSKAFHALGAALNYFSTLTYVATGKQVPSTWLWRVLSDLRGNST